MSTARRATSRDQIRITADEREVQEALLHPDDSSDWVLDAFDGSDPDGGTSLR